MVAAEAASRSLTPQRIRVGIKADRSGDHST